jgi:hypothetical protein
VQVHGKLNKEAFKASQKAANAKWKAEFWPRLPLVNSVRQAFDWVGRDPKTRKKGDQLDFPFLNFPTTTAVWDGLQGLKGRAALLKDHFAAEFKTTFTPRTGGWYKFFLTSSDGSKLYVTDANEKGGAELSNDGVHGMRRKAKRIKLTRGASYLIRVEYFERGGGAGLILMWEGPGFGVQPVPMTHPGYVVRLWANAPGPFRSIADAIAVTKKTPYTLKKDAKNIDFAVKVKGKKVDGRGVWKGYDRRFQDNFIAVVEGYLHVPRTSRFTFWASCDDKCQFYIDGVRIINNRGSDKDKGCRYIFTAAGKYTECEASPRLTYGLRKVHMYYYQNTKTKILRVKWAGPTVKLQVLHTKPYVPKPKPKAVTQGRKLLGCDPSYLWLRSKADPNDPDFYERHYRKHISCSGRGNNTIRVPKAGAMYLVAPGKQGHRVVRHIRPVEPKKDGEFGVIERFQPPKDKWGKFFSKYDMSFEVGEKAVVFGNPREAVNMKHFPGSERGKIRKKGTLDAGMVYVIRRDWDQPNATKTQCLTH